MTSSSEPEPRTRHEQTAESTRRLLTAAVELFAEQGFEGTSAAQIGQRAGYSREMVRSRYGSKDALVASLWETQYQAYLRVEPDEALSGLERTLAQIETMRALAAEQPEQMRAMFVLCCETVSSTDEHPWIDRWITAFETVLRDGLRDGQADGSVRPDWNPEDETRALLSQILGLGLQWTGRRPIDFADELRRMQTRLARAAAPADRLRRSSGDPR